jgi:hypothetical protein
MLSIDNIASAVNETSFDNPNTNTNFHNFDEWIKGWDSIIASQLGNGFNLGFENIMNELESGIPKNHQFYQAPELSMPLPMLISQSIDPYPENSEKVCTVIPDHAYNRIEDDGKSLYQCTWENCDRKFTRRSANCRAHWLRHKKMSSFVCLTCSLGFKRSLDLARHKLTYHYTSVRSKRY